MANNFTNLYPQQNQAQLMSVPQPSSTAPQMQFQNIQFFPQPVGSVYSLSSASDINNIPISQNLSVGLCLNENLLCIKSLQNGVPATLIYHLSGDNPQNPSDNEEIPKIYTILSDFKERLQSIEKQLTPKTTEKGGKFDWQI